MKYIVCILLLFIAFNSFGQTYQVNNKDSTLFKPTTAGSSRTRVLVEGRLKADTTTISNRDTTWQPRDAGTVTTYQGNMFIWTGTYWSVLGGSIQPPIIIGSTTYQFQDSTNTPPVSFPAGIDSVYYMVGGNGNGIFAGHNYEIALYINEVFDSFIEPTENDWGFVLTGAAQNTWHQYNGTTWPRRNAPSWSTAGNVGGGYLGSTNNTNVFLGRNNANRIIFQGSNIRFPTLTGASAGLMGLGTTGIASNVQIGSGLSLAGGVLSASGSSPVYSSPAIQDSILYIEDGVFKYGTASGGGGGDQNLQQVTDIGAITTNTFGAITGAEGTVTVYTTTEDNNNSAAISVQESVPSLGFIRNGNSGRILADNITDTRNWQTPNIDGTFAVSGSVNGGAKVFADDEGNIDLTVSGGGGVTSIATTSPITGGTITTTGTIGIDDAAADGATKGAASFTANDFNSSSGNISIDYTNGQAASGSTKGFLTSSDWTAFDGKNNLTDTYVGYGDGSGKLTGSSSLTYASNVFNIFRTGLTTTIANAILTENTTAATSGVPVQNSPAISLRGHAWNTSGSGNDATNYWDIYAVPISSALGVGGTDAGGTLHFRSQSASRATLGSNGVFTCNTLTATNGTIGGNFGAFNGVVGAQQVLGGVANPSSSQAYRTTHAGSTIFSAILTGYGNTTGANFITYDQTNGLGFGATNDFSTPTRGIQRARIYLVDLTNTNGSEAGGLAFATQTGGTAAAERGKITPAGVLTWYKPMSFTGSTPSNSAGTGAGTSPTISVTGNDAAGYVTITTGTSPTASGDIVTITFSTALANTPTSIQITPANENAATEGAKFYVDQSTASSSAWKIKNTSSALTASTEYKFYYHVTQ